MLTARGRPARYLRGMATNKRTRNDAASTKLKIRKFRSETSMRDS